MTYALLVQNLDGEEREAFDRRLNGYHEKDARVLADLFGAPGAPDGDGSQ